jgi:hypothetical protein
VFELSVVIPPPPTCYATGCTTDSLVHWQRRLTADEIAVAQDLELQRRADAPVPFPDGVPLPDPAQYSHLVHACGQHAIHMEAATRIHQSGCSGPDSAALPACDCEPEPHPESLRPEQPALPDHWTSAATGGG